MKKLNKKGFTLIELMVVIAILVVIMGIALPNITSSIERSKQKQKLNKIQLIESAAELYFDRNKNFDEEKYFDGVLVSTLLNDGLLTSAEIEGTCDDGYKDTECCVDLDLRFQSDAFNCQAAY